MQLIVDVAQKIIFYYSVWHIRFFHLWDNGGDQLTQYWKIKDQIDTIKNLNTKLTYCVKDRDQICNIHFYFIFYYDSFSRT